MTAKPELEVYQLRVYLRKMSPLVWRRLLVRSDSTIADLHDILQIAMAWTDYHLHQFHIRGKRYGVARIHGPSFRDRGRDVPLSHFRFRPCERFLYEYDFIDQWEHDIWVEQIRPVDSNQPYPLCIGGARAAPPEDCGGPARFLRLKHHHNPGYIMQRLLEMAEEGGTVGDYWDELTEFKYWVRVDKFDRRAVNQRLQLFAAGDETWRCPL